MSYQHTTCQYLGPQYDPRTHQGPAPYCGCTVLAAQSYCAEHYPIVYAQGTALARRRREQRRRDSYEDLVQLILDLDEEIELEEDLRLAA